MAVMSFGLLALFFVGGLLALALLGGVIWYFLAARAREVNLTGTPATQKPDWMRAAAMPETMAALQADGEPAAVFDADAGEAIAAPFAEQIEDILRAQLAQNPALAAYTVDFGSAADGSLQIWVNGTPYGEVAAIPDVALQSAIRQAIETYQARR